MLEGKAGEGHTYGLEEMPDKVPFSGLGSPETWLAEQLPHSVWAGFITRVCCWKQHVLNTMGLGRKAVCAGGTSCPVYLGPTPRSCAYEAAVSAVSIMDPSLGFAGFPGEGDSV